ncbi:MAG: twin-arginine translocase TatA/TatE family subunit [OCS116 cluster bacterium]|uniref:Sec-independent protein translocase protein TatA n=1 Tax=OCS116 cluster bacterium TaxID=2030921 RepID=A0A2A4Z297_9PROT|nr:twin-arginine translocase TatA/TatE family subunit [OCS116 cluster bacterium]
MPGWTQILLVVILAFLLFGRNKFSSFMGDFAKGINIFKKEMKDVYEDEDKATIEVDDGSKTIAHQAEQIQQEQP